MLNSWKRRVVLGTFGAAVLVLAGPVPAASASEPTHADVRYHKKYERSVMDIWTVESDKPAPLVVMFHGGGFKMGDKSMWRRSAFIRDYHPRGVAFAAVNYPFLEHAGDHMKILRHTEESIRFLVANARKYKIDPRRISVMGGSAGALISGYLAYGTKQPIRSVHPIQQPMGTDILILPILRKGAPPTVLYTTSGPGDHVHHPDNAKKVNEKCKKVGVYCEMYGTKQSGLPLVPEGKKIHDLVMKVFYKSWQLPFPGDKGAAR